MKNMKSFLAVLVAAAMVVTMAAPALAAEAAPVITGVVMNEASANYVDSSLYSQYESVEFSDGSVQTIDADAQTFILVKDGAIVDLFDPENWTDDAELYVIDKGQYDEVMMSMNTANWGPFYFTGAVTFEDGAYAEEKSVPAAVHDAQITDEGITGGEIDIDADYISGIYVYNETGAHTQISDVTLNSKGLGGNDFGTKGGWGTVISVAGTAQADINNVVVNTEGPLHDGIWAGGSSIVNVTDTVVIAKEKSEEYGFVPYSYDRFIIAEAPLTEEEIAAYGISGEYYAEDYESMFGSGTHYYYYNDNYTSNFSAPMLQCVPLALGLYGSMRGCICYGSATLSFYDSLAISDIWAVLSTDSGNGTLNATDTIALIGEVTDAADADEVVTVNGVDYGIHFFDTTESSGYVTYCDGFDDNFFGCRFYAPDYIAILTGGTFDFTESETQRGYGKADRIGFMSHGNAYTAVLSHSDFDVADALFAVMSTGAVDITLDDVTVNIYGEHPWSGVLFQFMDTDDTGTGANDLEMDILDLTYEEYQTIESAADGTTKTVTIKNSDLTGDIYNSVGSSNNTHVSDAYDGTTNILSTWNASCINVALDQASLTGVVSISYAQHVDEEGNPIEGLFFFNKDASPMEGTADNTYTYLAGRRVMNTPAYNGLAQINMTVGAGSTWNVTGESILNSLTVEEGGTVYGTVTENENGTITVAPAEEALAAGVYGTVSELEYVEPAGSGGESGGGEPAEGESAEGAAPEGESAEGAAPEGESAEGAAPEGESGGGAKAPSSEDFEITVDGVTDVAHYEDVDNGDQATKSFTITFDGKEYTGKIDRGVWTADDPAGQAVVEAFQQAHESDPSFQGAPPAGDPGDSPADEAQGAGEQDKWAAYIQYLNDLVDLDKDFELYAQLKSEIAEAKEEDYHGMEDGTMYGALQHSYSAVSFEEFEIGMPLPDITSAQGIG